RVENIRRAGEVAGLLAEVGVLVITAFISPYRADRDQIRSRFPDFFHEIHLAASVAACEARDVKGLYARARAGEIKEFTGVSAPYEAPREPELVVETGRQSVEDSLALLASYIERNFGLG
ncbi:MAG TPA: adenylyl-sulfate kinase, partial [Stellaceae bacterium]|nr:adenylyl-sulfate kinase [Stellaceae bacterium]